MKLSNITNKIKPILINLYRKYVYSVNKTCFKILIRETSFLHRVIRVKQCDKSFPKYMDRLCHVYTYNYSKINDNYKPIPVLLLDKKDRMIVVHFILTDGVNYYDCGLINEDLDVVRYVRISKEAEDYILNIEDPDDRLYTFKYIVQELFKEQALKHPILWLWRLLPCDLRLRYF